MATRSAIAVKTELGWWGVYHHFDGYPTGLGAHLWKLLRDKYSWDMGALVDDVVRAHPGGWSHIFDSYIYKPVPGGRALAPGEGEVGPACYCHTYAEAEYPNAVISGCYCDGETESPKCDPLWIEWVYVFDPEEDAIEILTSNGRKHVRVAVVWVTDADDGSGKESITMVFSRGRRFLELVVAPEPPWEAIEEARSYVYDK